MIRISFIFMFLIMTLESPGNRQATAQVLATGENGGQGSQVIMMSANAIFPKDYTVLSNAWVQYAYGLHDRVDIFASYGALTAFGRTQHYFSVGSNIGLAKRDLLGVDLALYNNCSVPFNRRDQSSTVLLNSAVIASRPFKVGGRPITLYGGFNTLAPIGRRSDKVFTPAETVHSGIIGVAVPVTRSILLFFEYNPGPLQRSMGSAVMYTLPNKR